MKKILLFLSLTYFSYSYSQTDYSSVYDSEAIFKKGIELHNSEKYAEAIAEYDKIDKLDPQFLRGQYEKALSLSAFAKNSELKTLFEDLHKSGQMAMHPSLYVLYGSYLSNEKEYAQSEKIFKEGEKLIPNSSDLLYNMAILYAKQEQNQKSVDILKRIISIHPSHASSHYLLGSIALDNGHLTEGTLALMSYLIISPTGRHAEKVITKLNSKYGENFLEKGKIVFSESGDNFEEIDVILRNQLPLKKAYKVKSQFDDIIIRQVQAVAEYSTEHKMGNGFFETTYIPWVQSLMKQNQFEGYSYYILLSMENQLGKKLTAQKKTLTSFYDNYILKEFWPYFSLRKLEHYGKVEEVNIFIENNFPNLVGVIKNGKKEGKFKLLYPNGKTAGDLNFKNDLLDGLQKYYDEKGNVTKERNYADGKLDGVSKEYFKNGQLAYVESYKDNLLHGLSYSYHVNGSKNCEINFTNGERDGLLTCLYENGTKRTENNFSKGKMNGISKNFNANGDLIYLYTYENNLLNGDYKEFLDGKFVKSEAKYKNDKVDGTFKTYYNNKTLERENFYENGKLKKIVNYYPTGKVSHETLYDSNEEIESYSYFDPKENKFFEEKFKSGELKSGIQFTKKSPKPVGVNLAKKPFAMYNYDGEAFITGNFERGKKTGEWKYNYPNGNLRLREEYTQGKQNGTAYSYNKNGMLNTVNFYRNDTLQGVHESYDNGAIRGTYNYKSGKLSGPFKNYNNDKSLANEGFYVDDELNYDRMFYWQDGKLSGKNTYIDGVLASETAYNTKGEKEFEVDYKNKTGKFTHSLYNGNKIISYEMANGDYNGKYVAKDKFNTPISEGEYVNGIKHNNFKSYGPLGTLTHERTYYAGKLNGIEKTYDLVGNHRLTNEYIYGEEYNKTIRFYHNKAKMYEYNQLESNFEGEWSYFNQKGEALLTLGFLDGALHYYIKKGASGDLTEKIEVANQTAEIVSSYPNGKTAITLNYVKGSLEGKIIINSADGKPEYEANYKGNVFNGERKEYYPNGKIYKLERFNNGDYEGQQEYFKEDGKPWLTANYKNDQLHGKTLIYANGAVATTKIYNTNELVEIIK